MKATLFLIDIALREKTAILEPWMVGILVLIFAGHAWIRVNYPRRLANLFNALINVRMMRQMMREELALSHRASIILIGQFFLIVSLFIYTALTFFQVDIIPGSGFGLYLKILFIIILMYLVKALTITLIKLISDGDFGLTEYNFMVFLTNKFLGLLLLPLLILASVWPTHVVTGVGDVGLSKVTFIIICVGLALIALNFLIRNGRAVGFALSTKVRFIYIILYLCTLEFLPLALLVKVLNN